MGKRVLEKDGVTVELYSVRERMGSWQKVLIYTVITYLTWSIFTDSLS